MAFPIPAQTFSCAAKCGWTLTTPGEVGDCRIEGVDAFRCCPVCKGPVQSRNSTWVEAIAARLQSRLTQTRR